MIYYTYPGSEDWYTKSENALLRARDGTTVYKLVPIGIKRQRKSIKTLPFEVGKTYKTTSGYSVRIICTDRKMDGFTIVGLCDSHYGEILHAYYSNGAGPPPTGDLIPETIETVEDYLEPITEE